MYVKNVGKIIVNLEQMKEVAAQHEFALALNILLSNYGEIPALYEKWETAGPKIIEIIKKLIAVVEAAKNDDLSLNQCAEDLLGEDSDKFDKAWQDLWEALKALDLTDNNS